MKITRIGLQNFRAFDEGFELDLEVGRNLLLHGENGAGKSSLYFALKRFFEERGDDIAKHRNHFAPEARTPLVRLQLEGIDDTGARIDREVHWDEADGHPLRVPRDPAASLLSPELRSLLVDGSRRSGFLDYRVMLRTHLLAAPLSRSNWGPRVHDAIYGADDKGLEAQLFDLVSLELLSGVRVPARGGETTIGSLGRKVWENRPASRHRWALEPANATANNFQQAFNGILPQLEAKLTEFLGYFENHHLTIKFQPLALTWDKGSLQLRGAELIPEITFRGKAVKDHHRFLNEARLSALSACLFFAGVVLSDNDYPNPAHPRFLVLDDALIGLELQNRLPVVQILSSDAFKNYQVLLLTHDRVWFDLARGHLTEKDGWLHRELLADEDTGHLVPRLKSSQGDLDRAKAHLANGDLKAAAVYARSAFEWRLRRVSEDHGIKIPFKPDADKVGAGVLWHGIIGRQREREQHRREGAKLPDLVPKKLERDVETMRSTVLNKLSHVGASGLVMAEVGAAIQTVTQVMSHSFPKK